MQSYDGFWLIPRNFVFFARSCCDRRGCFVTYRGGHWHSCRIPPCYIRKFFRSFRKNFRSTQELCLGCFFYAYLCIVKAVAARKTGPLTARQTNLRKSIEEMNKQLIKKFKKYLESKSAFYIYLKMYRDRRIGGAEGSGTFAPFRFSIVPRLAAGRKAQRGQELLRPLICLEKTFQT